MRELIINEVEYAYNTDTTLNDDTTSFGYGADGVLFGSYENATVPAVQKRVRFKTHISSDDVLVLQYQRNGKWIDVREDLNGFHTQGTDVYYGVWMQPQSTDPSVVDVFFGSAGFYASGANFGADGAPYPNTLKWRVRKSKSANAGLMPSKAVLRAASTGGDVIATTAGYVNIVFDTLLKDTHDQYDTSTGTFTAYKKGVYSLSGQVLVTCASVGTANRIICNCYVFNNDDVSLRYEVNVYYKKFLAGSSAFPNEIINWNCMLDLEKGDKVKLLAYNDTESDLTVYGEGNATTRNTISIIEV